MSEQKSGRPDATDQMKKRNTYSGSFKAKVVLELIRGERGLTELADQYRVHPNQIKNWKSRLLKQAPCVLEDKRRARKKGLHNASERNL
jgi:transposase-like protein